MCLTMPHADSCSTAVLIIDGDGQLALTRVPTHLSMCPLLGWIFMKTLFALLAIRLHTVITDNCDIMPLVISLLTIDASASDIAKVICYLLPPVVRCLSQLVTNSIQEPMHVLPLKHPLWYHDKSI
jgi:hypothetical protein